MAKFRRLRIRRKPTDETLMVLGNDAVLGLLEDAGGVTATEIADGAVDTDQLAADAVDSTKLADNAVGNEHLQNLAVDTEELAAGAVTSGKIEDGTIASADLSAGVLSDHIKVQHPNTQVSQSIPTGSPGKVWDVTTITLPSGWTTMDVVVTGTLWWQNDASQNGKVVFYLTDGTTVGKQVKDSASALAGATNHAAAVQWLGEGKTAVNLDLYGEDTGGGTPTVEEQDYIVTKIRRS